MHPRKEPCRNFQRGYCQYGERCRFLHANQQQQAKPNPFGFGTQSTSTFPSTNSPQPQKPNPFGFGVKNNSQTGSNSNQFKSGENKWSRFGPTNAPTSQKQDKQSAPPNHVCTDSESCKRQIAEDFENEKPVWKLTCYGHSKCGPCDIVGDISYEELRAVVYDEAKRGTSIQSIVERERSLLSSKLIEFENLLRNPYTPPQNSTLTTQNAFPGSNGAPSAPGFSQTATNFNSGTNTNLFSQTIQNTFPTPVASFSQLNKNFNTTFQMSPAAPNNATGPVSQFQAPTQISTPSQNSFAFRIPGQLSSQSPQQSFVSSFPASTSSFSNPFPVAATSPNLDSVRQQPSMPFGVQNPFANVAPGPVSSLQMTMSRGVSNIPGNLQSATSNIPSGKSLMYFGLLLASGVFFIFMAFTVFLPVIVLVPQKFALCFTVGCGFIIGSFFMLKGPKNQFLHMTSTERLPFTLGFIGSMVGTIYVSMVLHSYILSVFFAVIQVLALGYYCISYFPGGSTGMKFLTTSLTSSVMKCFGR